MKTAGQIDSQVSFTARQFAQCPALNEPPVNEARVVRLFAIFPFFQVLSQISSEL